MFDLLLDCPDLRRTRYPIQTQIHCCQHLTPFDAVAASSSVLQTLHSSAKGKYRTRGRYSSATVRGTAWTVTDRCDGTLTTVQRHTVSVQDFVRHVTVLVRQGHRYLAKAPKKHK